MMNPFLTLLGISIVLILFLFYLEFGRLKYKNRYLSFFFIILIILFVIYYFFISLPFNNKEKVVEEIFKIKPNDIDSLKISNYKFYNSFDYSTDIYYLKDSSLIDQFCKTINSTPKINAEINFRKYLTSREVKVVIFPEKYKNLEVEIFTLEGLGTYVSVSINEYDLIRALNQNFGPVIDTIIKKSKSVEHIEKRF